MKNTVIILTFSFILSGSILNAQAPNPPDKICFNYDLAGNRIAQNPAWIDHYDVNNNPVYIPDCIATENTLSSFGVRIILIKSISQLESVTSSFTNISWILNASDAPVGVLTGPTFPYDDPWIVLNPNSPIGVILDLTPVVKRTMNPDLLIEEIEAHIVPNPNDGQFEVIQKGFDLETTELYIIDNKGVILFKRDFVNGQINISEYASGTYLLVIKDASQSKTIRFVRK